MTCAFSCEVYSDAVWAYVRRIYVLQFVEENVVVNRVLGREVEVLFLDIAGPSHIAILFRAMYWDRGRVETATPSTSPAPYEQKVCIQRVRS